MIIIIYIVLLMGYGTLISIYYQEKKYKTAAIWALMFLCIIYLIIETYNAGFLL